MQPPILPLSFAERFSDDETNVSTEARQKDTALKREALQKATLNYARFFSIVTDLGGVIQFFDVGAERMLGYAAAEVMNKLTPADFCDPREMIQRSDVVSREFGLPVRPGFETLAFRALWEIEDIQELTYIRRDGSRFAAVMSIVALRNETGEVIGFLLSSTDNRERKKAEETQVKAAALRNAIFNNAFFSCIATDEKGIIQLFNVGAERMLGYRASEVVNKITPAALHDPLEVVERANALGKEFGMPVAAGFDALVFKASRDIEDIYELTKFRKDGSHFPALVSVTALRDPQEIIIGYLLIGTDNSAGKRAEEALFEASTFRTETIRQLNADLERRVDERTAQLKAANLELEAFSYSVSHDLRSPLRAIDGFSQVVLEKFGPQMTDDGRRYLQTIRAGAQKMGTLIDDLLTFARLNRQEMRKGSFDTAELVRAALYELGSPWTQRKVDCCIGKLPTSTGDRALLKQVWMNLLSNALKYTRKCEFARIHIGCEENEGVETFFVRDNGTGFDMRYAAKLFGVFQRFHRAEDYEGTGVGLAIVQRIVHRHGGRVWAEATVDQGATFYFTLGKESAL